MCAALLLGLAVASSAFAKGVAADHDGPYGTVYHPGDDVSNPVLVVAPDAVYPKSARLSPGQPGAVCVVGAIVDREGLPQDVHVVRSAGKDFDASAMKAVRQYRFKPGVRFGSPVAVAINIEVNFRKY
jgi:TonB family protein